MFLIKLIFIGVILFYLLRWYARRSLQRFFVNVNERVQAQEPHFAGAQKTQTSVSETEVLSSCPNCGTYFSSSQGVRLGMKTYCSQSCAS